MQNLPTVTEINREKQEYWKPTVADEAFGKADMFANFLNSLTGQLETKISEADTPEVNSDQVESAANELRDLTDKDYVSESPVNEHFSDDAQDAAKSIKGEANVHISNQAEDRAENGLTLNDMKDVKMTRRDLKEMKKELKAVGFSTQEIKEISKKIESDEGLTWGGFVEICAKKMVGAPVGLEFTASQQKELQGFFEKLGFAKTVAKKLISDLASGNYGKVMEAVEKKLGSMPPDKFVSMNDNEIRTFLAALKLPRKASDKLAQALSGQVSSKDIKKALEAIGKEAAHNTPAEQKLVRAITDALEKAKNRLLAQENAPNISAASAKKSVAANLSQVADQTTGVADQAMKISDHAAKVAEQTARPADKASKHVEQGAKAVGQASKLMNQAEETAQKDLGLDSGPKEGDEGKSIWKEFISRITADEKRPRGLLNNSQNAKNALFETLTKAADKASSSAEGRTSEKTIPRKVMDQVQDGILKNLSQGRKQLSIQLTPEGLGKVNVMLQVQSKEVQAVLRVENHETAAIVADQMDQVRQALAEQGLRVSKLEVQTGLAQSHGNDDWFGDKGHNQAMEKEARAMMQARVRALRAEAQESRANTMNNNPLHENGLHVVA